MFDREVEYCQGLGFIAGFALLHFDKNEEETFWFLVQLFNNEKHTLKDLFKPGLPKLHLILYQIDELLKYYCPKLFSHLVNFEIASGFYATSLIMTLFTTQIEYQVSERIWDIFLFEGWKHIIRTIVGVLLKCQDQILSVNPLEIRDVIVNYLKISNIEDFMNCSFSVRLTTKTMKQYEAEYYKKLNKK
jgi:hypothetical protein